MTTNDLKGYNPDQKAQSAVWAHCANLTQLSMISDMIDEEMIDETTEICVTKDTEAGVFNGMGFNGMGLFLKGKITAMFTRDIASVLNDHQFRSFGANKMEYLVEDYNDLTPTDGSYTESFLIPQEIVGVWMTKKNWDYFNKSPKNLKYFWKHFGGEENRFPITII